MTWCSTVFEKHQLSHHFSFTTQKRRTNVILLRGSLWMYEMTLTHIRLKDFDLHFQTSYADVGAQSEGLFDFKNIEGIGAMIGSASDNVVVTVTANDLLILGLTMVNVLSLILLICRCKRIGMETERKRNMISKLGLYRKIRVSETNSSVFRLNSPPFLNVRVDIVKLPRSPSWTNSCLFVVFLSDARYYLFCILSILHLHISLYRESMSIRT